MIICKDCIYYDNKTMYVNEKRLGKCKCPKILYGYHYRNIDIPDDGVLIEDDEGWGAIMGHNFGCIHGVKKSDKER